MPSIKVQPRLLQFDIIRVFAIIGVVAMHAQAITSSTTNYLGGISWWFANTMHSLVCISVPLFVMLTGALMLSKPSIRFHDVWSKVYKQFLLPLGVWWLLYYWWQTSSSGQVFRLAELFKRFFYTDIGHLYYLQVVIGLYLVLPVIHRLIKSSSYKRKLYILVVVTVLTISYKLLSFLVFKTYYNTNLFLIFLPYVSYLLWGEFLSHISLKRKQLYILLGVSAVLTLIISVLSYINTTTFNQGFLLFWSNVGGNFFWDVFTPPVMMLACIVFICLLNLEEILPNVFRSRRLARIITTLSGASFGVYLIHPWVMEVIDSSFQLSIQFISYSLAIWYIQRLTAVFIASTVLVLIMHRIPGIKYAFGIKSIRS